MNEYFQPGAVPAPSSPGSSAVMRQEFSSVATGFDKLPVLAGHANELVVVSPTGDSLVTTNSIITDFVTLSGVQTLTNKTIAWASNTFPGFGTSATKDAGTLAGNVLLLSENNKLPSLNGSLLTGLNFASIGGTLSISQGGTGASDLNSAQANLGIDLKAPIFNPSFTGAPSAPTPPTGDASSRVATTYFVTNTLTAIGAMQPGTDPPLMDGIAAVGVDATKASRQDHVHPSDTSRAPASAGTAAGTSFSPAGSIAAANVQLALQELDTEKAPLASPALTGAPTAPTVADSSDTTTKIATTAWVQTRLVQIPVGVQLSNSVAQNLGVTPSAGVGVEASRWDHIHAYPIASQIQNVPAGGISAINVQNALNELDGDKSPVGHTHVVANITDLTATTVTSTAVGGIAATNVQAALAELDSEKQNAATAVQKDAATGVAKIPTGTTAQRPGSPVQGDFRRNSELLRWEGYTGSQWDGIGGGQMYGLAQVKGIFYNAQVIDEDLTVLAGQNGGSFGPITVADGRTVTVENGSVWSIT